MVRRSEINIEVRAKRLVAVIERLQWGTMKYRVEVSNAIGELIVQTYQKWVPVFKGRLQRSFKYLTITTRGGWGRPGEVKLRVWSTAPYFHLVDEGFKESPGRYISAINKRYRKVQTRANSKQIMMAFAESKGLKKPRGVKMVFGEDVVNAPSMHGVYYHGKPEPGLEQLGRKFIWVSHSPEVKTPAAYYVERHEWAHAIQDENKLPSSEEQAFRWASEAEQLGLQGIARGMHPGFKGDHFTPLVMKEVEPKIWRLTSDMLIERVRSAMAE